MQEMQKKVAAIFAEIVAAYDFANFTLEDFAVWLSRRRGRPIEFWPMPPDFSSKENLMGFWAIICGADCIVYLENTLPIHQLHIQLHELAHLLCGHTTAEFDGWEYFFQQPSGIRMRLGDVARSSLDEWEAETLACWLFHEITRHRNRQQLTSIASYYPEIASYWSFMEVA